MWRVPRRWCLGMKAGLPPQLIFDLIKIGAGNSRVFELRAPMMVKDRYDDPTMKISVWQKDMDVIGSFAQHMRRADAAVLGHPADLCRGDVDRPCRPRHRRRLRRAREHGGGEARQGAREKTLIVFPPCPALCRAPTSLISKPQEVDGRNKSGHRRTAVFGNDGGGKHVIARRRSAHGGGGGRPQDAPAA